ncbi:MAG: amidohydrolase family protein, partial [Synergistaceae bacterium]|nr:amidohydrolase family protein [Synergistaceae bacterium]
MIDTHMHIFDASAVKKDSTMRYAPTESAFEKGYRLCCEPNGISGCIYVQPSFLKCDNSYLLNSMKADCKEKKFKTYGVAVLEPSTTESDITSLIDAGILGVRLNLIRKSDGDIEELLERNIALMKRVGKHSMHLELHIESPRLMRILDKVASYVDKIVIDHFALPAEGQSGRITREPEIYGELKKYADLDKIWIKTSGAYRVVPNISFNEAVKDCTILAKVLADFMPQNHILWGSDWPYTMNSQKV